MQHQLRKWESSRLARLANSDRLIIAGATMVASQKRKTRKKKTDAARSRALHLLDDVELLCRYLYQLNRKNHESLTQRRRGLQSERLSPSDVIAHFNPIRRDLLKRSKCTADLGKLRAELLKTPANWPGVYIPLWQIEQDFPGFRDIIPTQAPAHALFFVLVRGVYDRACRPEVWVAEAALCEDMCMAVNELCSLKAIDDDKSMFVRKRQAWLARSVIVNSFLFIEAFLNGIGIECLVKRWTSLSKNQRQLLAEFDFDTGTESWINFRDKLLKYPRMAVGKSHPLLQESNDEDVEAFLGEFRELRDSIIHASHRLYGRSGIGLGRAERLMNVSRDRETALRCADSAVRLVRKLHAAMGKDAAGLPWLFDRDPKTGMFPPKAFE